MWLQLVLPGRAGGPCRGVFSKGLFPQLAWLQLLPVLFEGRRSASPDILPTMCNANQKVTCDFLVSRQGQTWLLFGAVLGAAPKHSPGF